jgi:DNA polymerase-1
MAEGAYFVFNSKFELSFFEHHVGEDIATLVDVANLRKAKLGGSPLSLKRQVKLDLNIEMEKEEQLSNWAAPELTNSQYKYAALDAAYTAEIADYWLGELSEEEKAGSRVFEDAVSGVVEMENVGLLIDEEYHWGLINMWRRRKATAAKAIRKMVPTSQVENINSGTQWGNFFKEILDNQAIAAWPKTEKTQRLQTSRDIYRAMSYNSPYPFSRLLSALMVYNRASKYDSTYGETLITKQKLSGRIYGRLNIAQAVTGRFSSSSPNMQNIPNNPVVRRSFIAGAGKKLVMADYSGVEIRVLAEMSSDQQLLHDCIYDDVHSRSAIAIYKIPEEEEFLDKIKHKDPWARSLRKKSKAFTFQLLYGASAPALSMALRCSVDEAAAAMLSWADRYPNAYNYRFFMEGKMKSTGFLPCQSGRTIYVRRGDRTVPVAANYPIQGSAGDVMYSAITETQRMLRLGDVPAHLMVCVHDELILLSPEGEAEIAKTALEAGMVQGWLNIFPGTNTDNLVEAVIGDNWGQKG